MLSPEQFNQLLAVLRDSGNNPPEEMRDSGSIVIDNPQFQSLLIFAWGPTADIIRAIMGMQLTAGDPPPIPRKTLH
jgi:hypothetical protein